MDFIFDPSLVLYLPLHELDGASFASKDAYGHLCTATGALWRPNGRYFDGTDDYISIPNFNIAGDSRKSLTVLVVVNGAAAVGTVVSEFDSGVAKRGWKIANQLGGEFQVVLSDDGSFGAGHIKRYTSSLTAFDSSFHMVGFTWGNGNLRLFCDGVEDSSPTKTNDDAITTIYDSGLPIMIGCELASGVAAALFNGTISEVLGYSRALTPQEIQRNYLATKWRYR